MKQKTPGCEVRDSPGFSWGEEVNLGEIHLFLLQRTVFGVVDTDQGAPHRRVLDGVLDGIRSGRYPPGGRLPSGPALGEEYGVHRSAAARALDRLRWIGLVAGPGGGIARVAAEPYRSRALHLVEQADEIRTAQEKDAGEPAPEG